MYAVTVNGKRYEVELIERRGPLVVFSVEGVTYSVEVSRTTQMPGISFAPTRVSAAPVAQKAEASSAPGEIRAPMPGIIIDVKVKAGQKVEAGTVVAVMEAMKMENNIVVPAAGTVKEIKVKAGDEVSGNQLLIVLA